jgi:hypothetical protein
MIAATYVLVSPITILEENFRWIGHYLISSNPWHLIKSWFCIFLLTVYRLISYLSLVRIRKSLSIFFKNIFHRTCFRFLNTFDILSRNKKRIENGIWMTLNWEDMPIYKRISYFYNIYKENLWFLSI